MKTLRAESDAAESVLLVFAGEADALDRWLLLDAGGVAASGDRQTGLPPAPSRTILAVPGEQVTVHWLDLAEGLAPAQAAAAARLMLADASAEPPSGLHVALGASERGLTPAALVPNARMAQWLAATEAAGLDPAAILPTPFLLPPPDEGYVRRDRGGLYDYRGPAAAFALEADLAERLVGEAPVETIDPVRFEAGLAPLLAMPALDLRQGPYARRRRWKMEQGRLRRTAMLGLALLVLTLGLQVATILSFTFSADRLESEAAALAVQAPAGRGAAFGASATILFEAVRATPNVEVARIEYRPDGSLGATVMMDGAATLAALRQRIEASGLSVEQGEIRNAGGRPTADMTVRGA